MTKLGFVRNGKVFLKLVTVTLIASSVIRTLIKKT